MDFSCLIQIFICFFTNMLEKTFSFVKQKSIKTEEMTEQTTEACDWN